MIRILIADDLKSVREGIKTLLADSLNIEIVGTAENGLEVLEKIATLDPDLILLDIEMPLANGIAVCNHISYKFAGIKTIILSSHQKKEYIRQAIKAGAKGYLLKNASTEELERAIHLVSQGYSIFESQLLEKLIKRNRPTSSIKPQTIPNVSRESFKTQKSLSVASSSSLSPVSQSSYVYLPPLAENKDILLAEAQERDRPILEKPVKSRQKDILQIWIFALAVVCVCLIFLVVILIYS